MPEFASEDDELGWMASLTSEQRLELLELSRLARYGADALARGIDRTCIESLSMDEFNERKRIEDEEEEQWRLDHDWPAHMPALRALLLFRRPPPRG